MDSKGIIVCSGKTCQSVKVAPLEDERYCVTVYYNDGCNVNECIDVIVKKIVVITVPNVFSPDGNNTTFYIEAYETIKTIKSMSIFDRWGNLAFFKENIAAGDKTQGWNGKFNNSDAIVRGVFVYKIEIETIEGKIEMFVGDVTVL
ncbi:MAG: gliding motility-associated C-terminal domain-containing protein [Saprospiraceae bacterium]|nr:gliding motility-associated C-terminal domain-containing protein [Saprospiraceae bacterium]